MCCGAHQRGALVLFEALWKIGRYTGMKNFSLSIVVSVVLMSPSVGFSETDTKVVSTKSGEIRFVMRTKHNRGLVRCGMYSNKKDWLTSRYQFKSRSKSRGRIAICHFKDIPPGKYAISAYHDADNNGKFNRNFLGIPSEDYAVSRNARRTFSAPKFKDASFVFKGGRMTLKAKM